MKKQGKERLMEMMSKLDNSFKPKLNENTESINYKTIANEIVDELYTQIERFNNDEMEIDTKPTSHGGIGFYIVGQGVLTPTLAYEVHPDQEELVWEEIRQILKQRD